MKKQSLVCGVIILLIAWATPLPSLAKEAFYAHMIMHMLVVAVAAPLLAIALAGSSLDLSEKYPTIFSPIPASVGELIIVWGWHAPSLHHFARHSSLGLVLEQSTFLLSGIWSWLAVLGGRTEEERRKRRPGGLIGLLLTSMHMTFLGALISLSTYPLYPQHSTLEDQHIGGAIMLIVGGAVYLSGGLWVTVKILKDRGVEYEGLS